MCSSGRYIQNDLPSDVKLQPFASPAPPPAAAATPPQAAAQQPVATDASPAVAAVVKQEPQHEAVAGPSSTPIMTVNSSRLFADSPMTPDMLQACPATGWQEVYDMTVQGGGGSSSAAGCSAATAPGMPGDKSQVGMLTKYQSTLFATTPWQLQLLSCVNFCT